MTALRRRMLEDMQVRHLSAGTQQVYLQHIARFARYCGRSPARCWDRRRFGPTSSI